MSFTTQALTALKRIFIVVGIAIAFTLGLLGAIYLSLRSAETKVPDIVGKDRTSAENTISSAGLNFRVRAMRPSGDAKPDTVLIQLPHAGEIVKVGQTVAVDISRPTKEGETPATNINANANDNSNAEKKPANANAGNANANSNENKPKKKPANKNTNANANRPSNVNARPTGTPIHSNANSNSNSNRGAANSNTNRRPPVSAPTP